MTLRIQLTILLAGFTVTCGKKADTQMQSDGSNGPSETNGTTIPSSTVNDVTTTSPTTSGTTTGTVVGTTSIISSDSGTSPPPPMVDFAQGDCDPWVQDCPPGEKCNWYASDGIGAWDKTKCFAVMESTVPLWSECSVVGNSNSGLDNCERGAMCWDVDLVNEIGHCVSLCMGAPGEVECPPKTFCRIYSNGVALCLESCDPIVQNCTIPGDICIAGDVMVFTCGNDPSSAAGEVHDPCESQYDCSPGFLCLPPSSAVECNPENSGCCEPFCDKILPNSCPGQGQSCVSYFPDPVPPEYAHVGYCSLPG